ncbi:MAG: hypothetical protein HY084_12605 [Gemmatimonadetes bacterium]|nr:hypothetical protein [Gemmatimonadota bacterium]
MMSRSPLIARRSALAALAAVLLVPVASAAQQKQDDEYTRKIKEYLQDPRISTELVDHLPASSTVPTPLKFFGKIVGTPGELSYAKDMNRYLEAIAKAAPGRARFFTIGKTEEGRDMVLLAIGDEATIRNLDKAKADAAALSDPRATSEERARELIKTAKPMYWITSGIHSPEKGGPEMLMELSYRLVVEETPFIQNIRKNVLTLITPVIEVDGHEKMVDNYYYNKARAAGTGSLPLMYWGKYVQHDNNRDGMGQFLALTRNVTKTFLDWHPIMLHDLHEAQTYLYSSTGSGPYNNELDPITVGEWWQFAENDVVEMTKRGVPGVWTYGFYDGWVPNYMFFIAHEHNAIGRFYEVQSYGPDNYVVTPPATTTSKEWFRPNPPLPRINWGPRNNTNIQESAILFSLQHMAKNRELYLENFWLKGKRAIAKGKDGPTYGWVIPADQRHKANAADAINDLRAQGLEVHVAQSAFKSGTVDVKAGDYIVRGDQPYRTLADMYFSLQNFAPGNPSPYDDTGWTFQLMRNLVITPLADKNVLDQKMALVTAPVRAAGGIAGSGSTVIVENGGDNNLTAFRFKFKNVKMAAAEDGFDAGGHHFGAGAFIIENADRAALEPALKELGLSAWAVANAPSVKTHDLDIPRIGYAHSWNRTQDEGWVRAALDTYGVPYTYFGDKEFKTMGNLREKFDVIIYPHVSGNAQSMVSGVPMTPGPAIPYKKSEKFPALGYPDSTDDIRGGMGIEGLMNLYHFVQDGGTLITEGATATLFPEYNLTPGVTVENPAGLFARGTILRGIIADAKSPLVYGIGATQIPVYFSQAPVLNAGGGDLAAAFGGFGGRGAPGISQNITPNATPLRLSPFDASAEPFSPDGGRGGRSGRGGAGAGGGAGFGGGRGGFGTPVGERPRVIMHFPSNTADMLLSGTLANADGLSSRAQLVDSPVGKGHVVMFAFRPFWRWQTQGTYAIGFNAIMNWNDLDAGKPAPAPGGN